MSRLLETLAANRDADASAQLDVVEKHVKSFMDSLPLFDDMTTLALKRL